MGVGIVPLPPPQLRIAHMFWVSTPPNWAMPAVMAPLVSVEETVRKPDSDAA